MEVDLDFLPWDRDLLEFLASVAPDAWLTGGGHAYRPFLDGVYGPLVDSWDVDVRVWGKPREQEVLRKVQELRPHLRWHVKDGLSWAKEVTGREPSCIEECFGALCLICLCFGVQIREGQVVVHWGHAQAEADLRAGILRPNPNGQSDFAPAKAKHIAAYYPGVDAPFIHHSRRRIADDYHAVIGFISSSESGGRPRRAMMSQWESTVADRIVRLRTNLDKRAGKVPWPTTARFPDACPWDSPDEEFRMWLVNQTRSRTPVGGRDEYLRQALDCQRGVQQKDTHQGWDLSLHVLHMLLQLETDGLAPFRRPLRIAALWHDCGKLWNVHTPGAHPLIGAKKWHDLQTTPRPPLTEHEGALVSCLIANHDVFGRLERGLVDATFAGAMAPSIIRAELAKGPASLADMVSLVKALWRADVGSISLLRWLLSLSDPLEQLILGGGPSHLTTEPHDARGHTAS